MSGVKVVTIESGDKTYEVRIGKMLAKPGWFLLHDLGRICGASLVEASEERFASAVSALFSHSRKDEIYAILEMIAKEVVVDGGKLDLNNYGLTLKCVKEFMLHNFEDFFSPLVDALKNTVEQSRQPEPETSEKVKAVN